MQEIARAGAPGRRTWYFLVMMSIKEIQEILNLESQNQRTQGMQSRVAAEQKSRVKFDVKSPSALPWE